MSDGGVTLPAPSRSPQTVPIVFSRARGWTSF